MIIAESSRGGCGWDNRRAVALLGEADVEEPPLAGALFNATEEAAAELDGGDGRGVGVKLVRASKEESGDFVVDDVECATVRSERGDGAAALCGIKDVGGVTIAQKPDTAAEPDMPQSAIESGCIDYILSPEEIAQRIRLIAKGEGAATDSSAVLAPAGS